MISIVYMFQLYDSVCDVKSQSSWRTITDRWKIFFIWHCIISNRIIRGTDWRQTNVITGKRRERRKKESKNMIINIEVVQSKGAAGG